MKVIFNIHQTFADFRLSWVLRNVHQLINTEKIKYRQFLLLAENVNKHLLLFACLSISIKYEKKGSNKLLWLGKLFRGRCILHDYFRCFCCSERLVQHLAEYWKDDTACNSIKQQIKSLLVILIRVRKNIVVSVNQACTLTIFCQSTKFWQIFWSI